MHKLAVLSCEQNWLFPGKHRLLVASSAVMSNGDTKTDCSVTRHLTAFWASDFTWLMSCVAEDALSQVYLNLS